MTVGELIKALEKYPKTMRVFGVADDACGEATAMLREVKPIDYDHDDDVDPDEESETVVMIAGSCDDYKDVGPS